MWLVFILLLIVCAYFFNISGSVSVNTFEAPGASTVVSDSSLHASVNVGGLQPAALQVTTAQSPLPYFANESNPFANGFADFVDPAALSSSNIPFIPTDNPLPVTTVETVQAKDITVPLGTIVPQVQVKYGMNYSENTDFPGHDYYCSLYGTDSSAQSCINRCTSEKSCAGVVDVKPGTNPVFPGGFCCNKNYLGDSVSVKGVDTYSKM